MVEQTLVMIKPDRVDKARIVLNTLDGLLQDYGVRIKTVRVNLVPRKIIENFYSPHKGKDFYERMIRYFENQPVVLAIYEGEEGIIKKSREVVGDTDPTKAAEGTIRYIFSRDSLEKAIKENRPVQNVIHCSDSVEEVRREINVWKEYFENNQNYIN